jgi:xylose isomerase
VRAFARGCMRTYLLLKERAGEWNADREIRSLIEEIAASAVGGVASEGYTGARAAALRAESFDRAALGSRGLAYERLDQLTIERLLGVRG